MYYPNLSTLKNYKIMKPLVDQIDIWLATLPNTITDRINSEMLVNTFEVSIDIIKDLLNDLCDINILEKRYVIRCPNCGMDLKYSDKQNLIRDLSEISFCYACDNEEISPTSEDVYIVYKLIQKPDRQYTLRRAIEVEATLSQSTDTFLQEIKDNPIKLDSFFFAPNVDDYREWKQLYEALDYDYGKNTTAKGAALDKFISSIFSKVPGISVVNTLKSKTNQIDCTVRNTCDIQHTMFSLFGPAFIMECKNEKDPPGITYFNKLDSIMGPSEIRFAIIVSRIEWTDPCGIAAWERFLKYKRIIVNLCDIDFNGIINDNKNLLTILHNKYIYLATNATKQVFD